MTKQRRMACSVIIQVELQSLLTQHCYRANAGRILCLPLSGQIIILVSSG